MVLSWKRLVLVILSVWSSGMVAGSYDYCWGQRSGPQRAGVVISSVAVVGTFVTLVQRRCAKKSKTPQQRSAARASSNRERYEKLRIYYHVRPLTDEERSKKESALDEA